jgi:hypothetical protein
MKKIMPRAVLSVDCAVLTVSTRMYNNLLDDDYAADAHEMRLDGEYSSQIS